MNLEEDFFVRMTDDELRIKADEIYDDLIDAVNTTPQSDWHSACFSAMYLACREMHQRRMPPPSKSPVGRTLQ